MPTHVDEYHEGASLIKQSNRAQSLLDNKKQNRNAKLRSFHADLGELGVSRV